MDFFTALTTIRKEFPHIDESELRSAMDSEVAAEEKRLTGQRKYARAVESTQYRITEWLKTGNEYQVDLTFDGMAKFVSSHRPACVWAVLRCKAITPPAPTLTKRLSWRTKQDQFFQSSGCGQVHVIHYAGACESCGRSVYSHGCQGAKPCGDLVTDSPDPRGIIPPEHCLNIYHASEYSLTGRDLVTCASCADDGERYHTLMARTKSSGIWTKPEVIAMENRRLHPMALRS
jgi:hypothetical protein